MQSIYAIWLKDPISEKVVDQLYLLAAKIFEYFGGDKKILF